MHLQQDKKSNKANSDNYQKARFGHEIKGTAKAKESKSERHSRSLEQVSTSRGEIDSYKTHAFFTNINEKQVQEKSKEVEQKNEYIPKKTEELFDQSLRYRRATAENVAFSYYLDHELTDISHGTTIICNQILINEGDGYNAKTGIFTAHIPGVYFLAYSIDSKVTDTNVRLLLDGTNLVDAVAQVDTMGSNMAIVRLERGQSVWLETHHLDHREFISTSTFHMVSFSGFLIYQY
ncbi:adiponectin-like [Mercenaria mercenaria]|uniref:adiponectin-like n=1 Tax=Mercenaria mercenaria TaxID=6596 RepID=UPI00234F4E2D|nr:adiponectin-like [Mercenaria mercenaria]